MKAEENLNKKPSIVYAEKGQVIYTEFDQSNDKFYIIKKGNIKLVNSFGITYYKEYLTIGDIFGIIECISEKMRINTSIALSKCELIEITKHDIIYFLKNNNSLSKKIIKVFSNMYILLISKNKINNNPYIDSNIGNEFFKIGEYFISKNEYEKAIYIFSKYLKNYNNNVELINRAKKYLVNYSHLLKSNKNINKSNLIYNKIKKGSILFSELEPINEFYIIKSGKVKITKIIDNKEVTLSIIEKGFVLGEMGILSNEPKSASVIAIEDTEYLAVSKDNFNIIFSLQPKIANIVLKKYSIELWKMIRKLERKSIQNPINKILDSLFYEYQEKDLDKTNFDNYKFEIKLNELYALCNIVEDRIKNEFKSLLNNDIINIRNQDIYLQSKEKFKQLIRDKRLKNMDSMLIKTLDEIDIKVI